MRRMAMGLASQARARLSNNEWRLFQAAVDGAVLSTDELRTFRRDCIAAIPLVSWGLGAPPPLLRPILANSWTRVHNNLRTLAGPYFMPMLRYAAYRLPDGLPDTVTVWRGVQGMTVAQARRGDSWSLNRGAACMYALHWWRQFGHSGQPLVLRRCVPRRKILYYWVGNPVREIVAEVILDMPPGGEVDPNSESWREAAEETARRRDELEGRPPRPMGLLWNNRNLERCASYHDAADDGWELREAEAALGHPMAPVAPP